MIRIIKIRGGGIFCHGTILLDGDILLMHCQMQTDFLNQIIFASSVRNFVMCKENQSKILTGTKKFPIF